MPARSKGPRLWLRSERRDASGTVRHAVWIIRDNGRPDQSTGCLAHDVDGAERALARYLATKHAKAAAAKRNRNPAQIPVADVLTLYARDIAPSHARPKETAQRLAALDNFFTGTLADVNGHLCREYAGTRPKGSARRELEDLRAAINHHRKEGLCSEVVEVVLPKATRGRDRWLTRSEAAKLLRAAWRYREKQLGKPTGRASRRHLTRFILAGLYTGSRAGAICAAALIPTPGRGWVDLDRGVFYRRPEGEVETKKRKPAVTLPDGLLAHLRRWRRLGQRYAVEFNGEQVKSVRKAFAAAVIDAKLPGRVTPHVLRHTAATWLMQAGVDLWEAAGFLGMSVETLRDRYGHHHPDFQSNARKAFHRHREVVAEAVARRA